MGSNSSKFKKYVQNGDEYAAMQVYRSSPELKKSFDPNLSYGESRHHNTAMHYAARHGMKHLLRTFLNDLGGDPNKRNAFDETVLHSACSTAPHVLQPVATHISISCVQVTASNTSSHVPCNANPGAEIVNVPLTASAQERRAACVALLLQWRGSRLPNSDDRDKVQIDAIDREGSSALHMAASAGLVSGSRILLAGGARSLIRDSRGRTAAQRAKVAGHLRLASLLESAMLFSEEPIDWCSNRWGWTPTELVEQEAEEESKADSNLITGPGTHEGLRPQELREAKDRLLVDTSDMLRVPLFTAEALLRDNEWCKDVLVERWMKDALSCCQAAGVSLPLPGAGSLDSEHPDDAIAGQQQQKTIECGICCEDVPIQEAGGGSCGHAYCGSCWRRYLSGRVRDGDARPVCPAPRCRRPAPPALLQSCLTPDTQRKYLLFDIKAFVESSRGMKWCPIAGCGRAVRLLEPELSIPVGGPAGSDDTEDPCPGGYPAISRGVDCGDFHFFCWECNGEAHAPLGCASWARWSARAGNAPPAPMAAACGAESAASSLWLLAHCKPCPSCSCPIQKNDGCNHMKCTKCKFDFCWVCLESWKRHGSATGGYFRCTREEAATRADQSRGAALAEARVQNVEAQEQWRFAVQCARFRRHELRWVTEKTLLAAIPVKARPLDPTGSACGILEAAARELALCRRLLAGACAYTFIMPSTAPHRAAFHYAQEELERCGARLAFLIGREIIEAPLKALQRTSSICRRWRLALIRLTRPPPPPAALSAPELRLMARLYSRGRLDARDPWRFSLGPRGEPLRLPEPTPDHTILQEPQLTISPRSAPERSNASTDADVYRINVSEYNMDLIIALEMSRLQMLEEQARRGADPDTTYSPDVTLSHSRQRPACLNISVSIGAPSDYEDKMSLSDDQLKLAIQLSLQEPMISRLRATSDSKMSMPDFSGNFDSEAGGSNAADRGQRGNGDSSKDAESEFTKSARLIRQEERWSRAADITVGYFLKALGGAPLDLPNLALGLDLLTPRQDKASKDLLSRQMGGYEDGSSSSRGREDQVTAGSSYATSGFFTYCRDGSNQIRPPLLRSGAGGQRPPLLRQSCGTRMRRSWSAGDISVRSISTEDTNTYNKLMEDSFVGSEAEQLPLENADQKLSEPSPAHRQQQFSQKSQTQFPSDEKRNHDISITRTTQQSTDNSPHNRKTSEVVLNSNTLKHNLTSSEQHVKMVNVTSNQSSTAPLNVSKSSKDRKIQPSFPVTPPWGQFCCERKCVVTNSSNILGQSPPKGKDNRQGKIGLIVPDAEPPATVSVDCRGKINSDSSVFVFSNDKTIHLPDLNSSHLKVNTYLTRLAINKHIGMLGDSLSKHSLNQNEIIGDNFRRHSDHIPRSERGQHPPPVKASSSEKHICDKSMFIIPDNISIKADGGNQKESPSKKSKSGETRGRALSIRISDVDKNTVAATEDTPTPHKIRRGLETDSSNECESETGIPKSPTLYISGVSICRETTSPKMTTSTIIHPVGSDSNVAQYFARNDSFRITNTALEQQQRSPKVRQKTSWRELDVVATETFELPSSPVVVRVTSPSLSPCSERNIVGETTTGSQEIYTPSLLRSATPTGPVMSAFVDDRTSNLGMLDITVLPPSHFSDDVFLDDDDPGLMIDCGDGGLRMETSNSSSRCSLRGTVYTGCHSGGIMISNVASIGVVQQDCSKASCSQDYKCTSPKRSQEALYENIYPQSVINDQIAFEMSLPNSPTGIGIINSNGAIIQKSWSARPLASAQEFTDESQANAKLKSKSANEPERDREMFHFPKSSTDGALSSVLHVQESNLSSDDFHEALFLLERSPKTRDSKRRKRSKKRDKSGSDKDGNKRERDNSDRKSDVKQNEDICDGNKQEKCADKAVNDKVDIKIENCCENVIENDSPSIEQDEASSAL